MAVLLDNQHEGEVLEEYLRGSVHRKYSTNFSALRVPSEDPQKITQSLSDEKPKLGLSLP